MIKVRQVKVRIENRGLEGIKSYLYKKLHIDSSEIISLDIVKESLDARDKKNILYIYEVDIVLKDEDKVLFRCRSNKDVLKTEKKIYKYAEKGNEKLKSRPIIVGSGPCGLFCAYILAELGYRPLVIERGEMIDDRVITVNNFWESGILNSNSNVSFGEGGAGTFSDGKLNTLVKDKFNRGLKVFETFVECGAPKEIMYESKPHVGTDILRDVVVNMRNKIISFGGEFKYNTFLSNLVIDNGILKQIEINNNELIDCDVLVLAIGHSARDTFKMLYNSGINIVSKPFAVGIRIQHPQDMINFAQYGTFDNRLPVASYKLVYNSSFKRGVYSFCMCPGGYVVDASSEDGTKVVNGMSYYKRDSKNANSAIIVTVSSDDFGNGPLDGIEFQRMLEKSAYIVGSGFVPVQLWGDYKNDVVSTAFGDVIPSIKGRYSFANLNDIFPSYINDSLKEAIEYFNTKIEGFSRDDAIIAGVESRTSSPVRILRDDNGVCNIEGIYPCGEGAGYAGGITTSAMDGIYIAENIVKRYSSF